MGSESDRSRTLAAQLARPDAQSRNEELTQALRDAELEMSRERANLARERNYLTRLRDDLRIALEKAQREMEVRQKLAPVHKLKEEMQAGSSGGAKQQLDDPTLSARLKDLLQMLGSKEGGQR